jgi:hypothetical protein
MGICELPSIRRHNSVTIDEPKRETVPEIKYIYFPKGEHYYQNKRSVELQLKEVSINEYNYEKIELFFSFKLLSNEDNSNTKYQFKLLNYGETESLSDEASQNEIKYTKGIIVNYQFEKKQIIKVQCV